MADTSCNERGARLLSHCLAGESWPQELVHSLVDEHCSGALFQLVEYLADSFEPRLCDCYARLFSQVIERVVPTFSSAELLARFERVRRPQPWSSPDPKRVVVLSRVTLGADIAVTGRVLEAAKLRFPRAEIWFAGGSKAAELFQGDPRVHHLPLPYPRSGAIADRIATWRALRIDDPATLVIDPDSRLTQLGLLPVCAEERYRFFESRAYHAESHDSLGPLTSRWFQEVFGIEAPPVRLTPKPVPLAMDRPCAAVSFGVGENLAKRVDGAFEAGLLALLGSRFPSLVIDRGAGGKEAERVEQAVARCGVPRERIRLWNGSFAGFAALLRQCSFYAGYDSAGQHAAAALGIPLVTIFSGFLSPRFLERWTPTGSAPITVIPATPQSPPSAILKKIP